MEMAFGHHVQSRHKGPMWLHTAEFSLHQLKEKHFICEVQGKEIKYLRGCV